MSTKNIIMTLALDRIIAIKKDGKHQYTNNTIFDPETYLREMVGVTRDLKSKVETVILWVSENQAPYVETKPFHHTQEIEKENVDGSKIFRLRIIINHELERKILGYGPHIKVIEPKHLKQRIANELILAAERYRVD